MNDKSPKPQKAYRNEEFLTGKDARPIRLLSEYIEPEARFHSLNVSDTIVFLGSARTPSRETALAALDEVKKAGQSTEQAEIQLEMSRYYEDARELARRLTEWSKRLEDPRRRFVICTGGGPGIMEAGNRGASEARGMNIGLNISIPMEQFANPYITRQLAFEFHYFFMRKFWFVYLAKAIVVFPGGFGTLDEFSEIMTLLQCRKMNKKMPFVLYGTKFWNDVINFDAMVRYGTISREDLDLFIRSDSVDETYEYVTAELLRHAMTKPGPRIKD
jgi:uncharacterized protein (TIGR00730 family)